MDFGEFRLGLEISFWLPVNGHLILEMTEAYKGVQFDSLKQIYWNVKSFLALLVQKWVSRRSRQSSE